MLQQMRLLKAQIETMSVQEDGKPSESVLSLFDSEKGRIDSLTAQLEALKVELGSAEQKTLSEASMSNIISQVCSRCRARFLTSCEGHWAR